jgi:hypothetical protein
VKYQWSTSGVQAEYSGVLEYRSLAFSPLKRIQIKSSVSFVFDILSNQKDNLLFDIYLFAEIFFEEKRDVI